MSTYAQKDYWDGRYKKQTSCYDWYLKWVEAKPQIEAKLPLSDDGKTQEGKLTPATMDTLIVGCGNSEVTVDMYNDGYTSLVSMDYSSVVIEKMTAQFGTKYPALVFDVSDCRQMQYADTQFDFVLDKGTLDAILCGEDSDKNAHAMLSEIYRVMRPGAVFIDITYGDPSVRLRHFEHARFKWNVQFEPIGRTRFMYTLVKPKE